MGRKVHNAKARQTPKVQVDNSETKDLKVELTASETGTGYDEANALVLPSKKRQTKVKVEQKQNVRILSKKQRKRLQAIVDKKHKKDNRAGILEALATVQIADTELKQYTSISQAQTVGLKKLQTLDEYLAGKQQKQEKKQQESGRISSIKGSGKRKLLVEEEEDLQAKRKNPNFVGLEEDDDDEDSADDSNDDEGSDQNNTETASSETATTEQITKETPQKVLKTESDESSTAIKPPVMKVTASTKPITETINRAVTYVPVHRTSEIQAARLKLPILAEEQEIMETINENNIIIISGETGSGKTTQIPQFLYEAGYAENNKMIGITEPRRVAAIAMSKRVAYEMQLTDRLVSYLIRFEGNVTPETRIKFMTDGVLLKEIESDFLLQKYSVIMLDEAHERSAYTDILVGLLSRIVPLRQKRGNPLKLIIMSATLRVEDFTCNTRLFKAPPPLIKVEARQFPVTIHFQKRTPVNYVDEAFRKTVKIHTRLPEGGILIFVTGQQEVNQLVRKLRRAFPYYAPQPTASEDAGTNAEDGKIEESKISVKQTADTDSNDEDDFDMKHTIKNIRKTKKKFLEQIALPKINLDDYKLPGDDTEADMHEVVGSDCEFETNFLKENDAEDADDLDETDEEDEALGLATNISKTGNIKQPLWVLPLYSLLSSEKQNRIFQPIPAGCRLCVVSTNVAETSLTIPNIKYVVDSGRQKTRFYDKITGVSAFVVTFTSKASADQRAGRAGRISAGHCYRLYSSAVYKDEFEDFGIPDIQKRPVDDLMLQMRCMGIDRVINFPFPSPPDSVQLQAAEQRLIILGALERLDSKDDNNENSSKKKDFPPKVTRLGKVISCFPVAPRFGKMLALSHQKDLLPYTVLLVAALSVQEVLKETDYENENSNMNTNKWRTQRRNYLKSENYLLLGDPMVLLLSIGATEYTFTSKKERALVKLCSEHGLRMKALIEVRKLRLQLTNEINLNVSKVDLNIDPQLKPPTDAQARFLRQILLAGMGDRVARKVPLDDIKDKDERRRLKYAYNCLELEEPVYMSSSSVLKEKIPDWVIYQEAFEVQNGDTTKMFIRGITAIEPEWLLIYVPLLCNIRAIKEDPSPRFNEKDGEVYCFVDASYGKAGWELPLTEMEMPIGEKASCYFGMFLLNGVVCPQLAKYKPKLKVTPSALTKSWANLNENVTRFKRTLFSNNISTRDQLFDIWKNTPHYLLNEYHKMLYDVPYEELAANWPPIESN